MEIKMGEGGDFSGCRKAGKEGLGIGNKSDGCEQAKRDCGEEGEDTGNDHDSL